MARSYYSVMLYHPADEVWAVIRPFDHYAWAGVEGETSIERGKAVTKGPRESKFMRRRPESATKLILGIESPCA